MKRRLYTMSAVLALGLLVAGGVRAEDAVAPLDPSDQSALLGREPQPRAALTAALLNIVFLPVRLPVTIIGAELAGVTGWLTAGNEHAANDVFGLVDGSQVITPAMLEKTERFRVSAYD